MVRGIGGSMARHKRLVPLCGRVFEQACGRRKAFGPRLGQAQGAGRQVAKRSRIFEEQTKGAQVGRQKALQIHFGAVTTPAKPKSK